MFLLITLNFAFTCIKNVYENINLKTDFKCFTINSGIYTYYYSYNGSTYTCKLQVILVPILQNYVKNAKVCGDGWMDGGQ